MSSGFYKFNLEEDGGRIIDVVNGMILGRERGNVLYRNDLQMSSVHAEFHVSFNKAHIIDLNSTNGVYVNGKRIAPERAFLLKDQDRIKLGAQVFVFLVNESEDVNPNIPDAQKIQFSDDRHEETVFVSPDKIQKKPK